MTTTEHLRLVAESVPKDEWLFDVGNMEVSVVGNRFHVADISLEPTLGTESERWAEARFKEAHFYALGSFIATFDPVTVTEMLDAIEKLRAELSKARKCVTLLKEMMVGHCWCETAKRTGYIKCNVCTTLSRVNEIERGEG